ncbi:MAG: AsmA family protein [Neomegalonema sp.]|nr:AsmA family protein [Neomegalonema sp.]
MILRILKYLGIFVLVAAVLIIGIVLLVPTSYVAKIASDKVREGTGRELVFTGDLSRTIYPKLGVKSGGVTLSNPEWTAATHMFAADEAVVSIDFWSIFSGSIDIEEVRLVRPEINLEVAEDGKKSWTFPGSDDADEAEEDSGRGADHSSGRKLSLELAQVVDGQFTYLNHQNGQVVKLTDIDVDATLPGWDQAFDLKGEADWNGQRVRLTGIVDSPAAATGGETFKADLDMAAQGLNMSFNGNVLAPGDGQPEADGDLALTLSGDKGATDWLRQSLPPELKPLEAVDLAGSLVAKPDTLDIDLVGDAGFRGQDTKLNAKAKAGAGWMNGDVLADVDVSVLNEFVDAGYIGTAGLSPEQYPLGTGKYRARVIDLPALLRWAGQPAPEAGTPLAKLASVDLKGDLDLKLESARVALDGGVTYDRRPVALDVNLSGGRDWRTGGVFKTAFGANSRNFFETAWDGDVTLGDSMPTSKTVAFKGTLIFDTPKLKEFARWAGDAVIDSPKGTFDSLRTFSKIAYREEVFTAEETEFTLGDTQAQGEMRVDLSGAKPELRLRLDSGPLDLRPFTQGGEAAAGNSGAAAQKGSGWSREPINVGVLNSANAVFDIEAASLTTATLRLDRSVIKGALQDGVLTANIEEIALYQGGAKGKLKVAAKEVPEFAMDFAVDAVQLNPILRDLAGIGSLEGKGSVAFDVTAAGRSLYDVMHAVNGTANVKAEDGAILGVNLPAMLRNVSTAFLDSEAGTARKTDFTDLGGSFVIKDGVATNRDFAMNGPLLRVVGEGAINLGEQLVDYRLTPKFVGTLQGQGGGNASGLAVPLDIKGPWASPSFGPDLSGAVKGIIENPQGALDAVKGIGSGVEGVKENPGQAIKGLLGGIRQDQGQDQGQSEGSGAATQQPANSGSATPEANKPQAPKPEDLIKGLLGGN